MEKSSSQALGHMTPCVLKCREANLYTFIRGGKLELLKLDHFKICTSQFTTIYLPTWLVRILPIDGAQFLILNTRKVVTWQKRDN